MDKKTTFNFVGSLVQEFPELLLNSRRMASGDIISWVNASIKVVDSIGGIVKLCIDKNNTKLLNKELEQEVKQQNDLEQQLLKKKLSVINEMKNEFLKHQRELQQIYTEEKKYIYTSKIEEQEEISKIMSKMRSKLQNLIDIYDNELSKIYNSEEYTKSEKRYFEECKRLLLRQFEKNIDV